MYLSHLLLEEFRLFSRFELEVPPSGLRIHGPNASGKSSLAEAIFMLSTTRSPRATVERELIHHGSGTDFGLPPYARLLATVATARGPHQLELTLAADAPSPDLVTTPRITRKRVRIDGNTCRAHDLVGRLRVVLFEPSDLELVLDGPSIRRRYLDITLCQLNPAYLRALGQYGRLLLQRNALLKRLAEAGSSLSSRDVTEQLAYWDEELVRHGALIVIQRHRLVTRLNDAGRRRFAQLSRGDHRLAAHYQSSVALPSTLDSGDTDSASALVARDFASQLTAARAADLRRGTTTLGPHRDDIGLSLDERPALGYASRGQQRLIVLALKLAEVDIMQAESGDWPVIVLDDLASELDPDHRDRVLAALPQGGAQLWVTATDRAQLQHPALTALQWLALAPAE